MRSPSERRYFHQTPEKEGSHMWICALISRQSSDTILYLVGIPQQAR